LDGAQLVGSLSIVRVVLDANIIISALITPDGVGAKLIKAWSIDRFVLLTHDILLAELRDVTRRPEFKARMTRHDAGRLINRLGAASLRITHLPVVQRSADPHDDFLLGLSEGGRADILVSGDKRGVLALKSHGATRIMSARQFHDELGL
jgi:uncharacterized protein